MDGPQVDQSYDEVQGGTGQGNEESSKGTMTMSKQSTQGGRDDGDDSASVASSVSNPFGDGRRVSTSDGRLSAVTGAYAGFAKRLDRMAEKHESHHGTHGDHGEELALSAPLSGFCLASRSPEVGR